MAEIVLTSVCVVVRNVGHILTIRLVKVILKHTYFVLSIVRCELTNVRMTHCRSDNVLTAVSAILSDVSRILSSTDEAITGIGRLLRGVSTHKVVRHTGIRPLFNLLKYPSPAITSKLAKRNFKLQNSSFHPAFTLIFLKTRYYFRRIGSAWFVLQHALGFEI